ncbi:hypothetical protein U1Q18_027218 [Sarracenia purpurea var. burkii]
MENRMATLLIHCHRGVVRLPQLRDLTAKVTHGATGAVDRCCDRRRGRHPWALYQQETQCKGSRGKVGEGVGAMVAGTDGEGLPSSSPSPRH